MRVIPRSVLTPDAATELVHRVTREGVVTWSKYGLARAEADGVTTVECDHTLVDGIADPAEFRLGEWRYHIHWRRMCVVVVFRSDLEAVVVEAWSKQR